MQRYILIRIVQSILALLVLTVIVFSLARIAGDPLDVLLPLEATVEDAERVRAAWGLDRPIYIQYFKFLGNALKGDFGESIKHRDQQAISLVFDRLPATAQLAGLALVVATLIAVPVGVLSAVKKDTIFDYVGKVLGLDGPVPARLLAGPGADVDLRRQPGTGAHLGQGRHRVVHPAGPVHRLVPGGRPDAPGALVHAGRAGHRVRQAGPHQGSIREQGRVETLSAQRRHRALHLFRADSGSLMVGSVSIEFVFAWPGVGLLAWTAPSPATSPSSRRWSSCSARCTSPPTCWLTSPTPTWTRAFGTVRGES